MKQHRIIGLLGLLLVFVLIVSGCAIGHASATATAPREKIVFWHEMTGPAADQLKKFATQFNASQKKYQIVPEFEGTYNEAVQKKSCRLMVPALHRQFFNRWMCPQVNCIMPK